MQTLFNYLGADDVELDCNLLEAVMDGLSLSYTTAPDHLPIDATARQLIDMFLMRRKKQ